jgi:hypothetical protein
MTDAVNSNGARLLEWALDSDLLHQLTLGNDDAFAVIVDRGIPRPVSADLSFGINVAYREESSMSSESGHRAPKPNWAAPPGTSLMLAGLV